MNARVHESLGAAAELAPQLGTRAARVVGAAQHSFTQGFVTASVAAAAVLTVTGALAAIFLERGPRR